jgi:hypothetical protein
MRPKRAIFNPAPASCRSPGAGSLFFYAKSVTYAFPAFIFCYFLNSNLN